MAAQSVTPITSDEQDIILDRRATAGVVALNRPAALNAVNRSMVRTLRGDPELWRHDDTVEAATHKSSSPCHTARVRLVMSPATAIEEGDER